MATYLVTVNNVLTELNEPTITTVGTTTGIQTAVKGFVDKKTWASIADEFWERNFSAHLTVYIEIEELKSFNDVTILPKVLDVQILFLLLKDELIS